LLVFSLFLSQRSDSGIFLRIIITNNAGKTETIKASLHPMIGAKNPPTIAANIKPTGFPVCSNAPNFPLIQQEMFH
jgi:hypothetical protein